MISVNNINKEKTASLDSKNSILYEDNIGKIYRSKLIRIAEEIVHSSDIRSNIPKGFKSEVFKTMYTLTFDEGNEKEREFTFHSCPENMGEYYYYVIKNNDLICLCKEEDELDKYIAQGMTQKSNIFTKLSDFWLKMLVPFAITTFLSLFLFTLYAYLTDHLKHGSKSFVVLSMFSLVISLLPSLSILVILEEIGKAINTIHKRKFIKRVKTLLNIKP